MHEKRNRRGKCEDEHGDCQQNFCPTLHGEA
jgi:hypothetical protein